jgi:O-antigen ligase
VLDFKNSKAVGMILSLTALFGTIVITPGQLFDPINLPKLAVIAIGGFLALGLIVNDPKALISGKYRKILIWTALFNLQLALVLAISKANNVEEFYGVDGRSTGFLAYFSLSILLLAGAIGSSAYVLSLTFKALILAGVLSTFYGILQYAKLDPVDWSNPYNPILGFLGNPNFQSSFIGIYSVALFASVISVSIDKKLRFASVFLVFVNIFIIVNSDSQQGLLVLIGGCAIVFWIWLSKSGFKRLTPYYVATLAIGFISVVLGTLNKGPLGGILYKPSVTYRGDYWEAGWNITTQNPLFGVGLDNYGSWYRRARSIEATLRRGPDVTSNAAHNVFFDMSSNGGIPLLVLYLVMIFLVFRAIIVLSKRSEGFNPVLFGLVGAWIAYLAQSVISLNQLGLAVWGWIISGLIIGYEINTRDDNPGNVKEVQPSKGRNVKKKTTSKTSTSSLVLTLTFGIIGLLVVLPALLTSNKVSNALTSRSAETIVDSAKAWPRSSAVQIETAALLSRNNLDNLALEVVNEGILDFPDNYLMWGVLSELKSATPAQVEEAKRQMKRLDPLNPNLK